MIETKHGKTKIDGSIPEVMADLSIVIAAARKIFTEILGEDGAKVMIQESINLADKAFPDEVNV